MYKSCIAKSFQSLIKLVDSRVLLDVKFPDGAFNLPKHDNYNTDTSGYGLFSTSIDSLSTGNHPASHFLEALCQEGRICAVVGNDITWDTGRLSAWLKDISEAWSTTLVLLHLLSLPGRGTEEVVWQHANSPSSPRHLYLSTHLQTLITQSNYSKTTALTGLHKYIIRAIPYPLALVIVKLLQVVRPVETLAVTKGLFLTAESRQKVLETYQVYMFVSIGKVWTSDMLSQALRHWFERNLNVPFGLQLHRHFAQALQRKFHSYKESHNLLADAANKSLGHGQGVADINYAREGQDLAVSVSNRERFEEVASRWITWHGVMVSPPNLNSSSLD